MNKTKTLKRWKQEGKNNKIRQMIFQEITLKEQQFQKLKQGKYSQRNTTKTKVNKNFPGLKL